MAINHKRTDSFKRKPAAELERIAKSGSLGAAAAHYELMRRKKENK